MASKMNGADHETEEKFDSDSESERKNTSNSDSSVSVEMDSEDGRLHSLYRAMDTNVRIVWDSWARPSKKSKAEESFGDDSDSNSSDSCEYKSEDGGKVAVRRIVEEEIHRRESALAYGTADDNPGTAAHFECFVSSCHNSLDLD
ncbi:hypothetical protein ACHAW6_009659 [Cyclotella cf. meneghiniana]